MAERVDLPDVRRDRRPCPPDAAAVAVRARFGRAAARRSAHRRNRPDASSMTRGSAPWRGRRSRSICPTASSTRKSRSGSSPGSIMSRSTSTTRRSSSGWPKGSATVPRRGDLPVDRAVAVQAGDRRARSGRAGLSDCPHGARKAARHQSRNRAARSMTRSPRPFPKTGFSGSTIIWARSRCRICSRCGSPI